MKKAYKGCLILVLLLFITIGTVNATDVSNDTTTTIDDSQTQTTEPIAKEATSTQNNIIQDDNNVEDETENTIQTYTGENPETISSLTNGNEYENAVITLSNDQTFTDAAVTFKNNVTLTSSSNVKTLTNLKINVNGNNVTIANVNFTHNVASDAKVININQSSNVTLNNANINLYKTTGGEVSYETKAITITDSECVKINSSNIEVSAESQALAWKTNDNWVTFWSEENVLAILVDGSKGVCITNNNINIYNNTQGLTGTTMPAIVIKSNTNNSCIKNNNIAVTGSHYNYGVMCSDYVSDLIIRDNNVNVIGEKNVVGIDASTSTGSVVYNNNIHAYSTNTVGLGSTEQSLAYGILTNTYTTGNTNNYVAYNTIDLTGIVCYGIENYIGDNNIYNHNTITADGTTVMGIGSWGSTDCKFINNEITLTGEYDVANNIYEQINPQNVGLILTGNITYQSTGNIISGNTINLTVNDYEKFYNTIILDTYSSNNNVYDNYLTSHNYSTAMVEWETVNGNDTVQDNGNNNNVNANDISIEYIFDDSELLVCICNCCSNEQLTEEESSVQVQMVTKKNTNRKNTKTSSIITLNTSTFSTYVTDGEFNDNVQEGDVINIEGILDGSQYSFTVNKPLNITSLNNDAYLNFNSSNKGDNYVFKISESGSGTNITNLKFHNTHLRTEGASNITINNIYFTHNKGIGFGVGAVSIRSSENVNITNSYFSGKDNAGHSIVVYATSNNCLFENNTVEGYGNVGNIFYITTYNTNAFSYNITIRNNYIDNTNAINQSICQAMIISGAGHLIENNTIKANDAALALQYYDSSYGEEGNPGDIETVVQYNTILQGTVSRVDGIVYNHNNIDRVDVFINDTNWDEYIVSWKIGSSNRIVFSESFPTYANVYINVSDPTHTNLLVNPDIAGGTSSMPYIGKEDGIIIKQINSTFDFKLLGVMNINNIWAINSIIAAVVENDSYIKDMNVYSTTAQNCYVFGIKENTVYYGSSIKKNRKDYTFSDDTIEYLLLTNSNYNTIFDEETFTLKEGLTNYNLAVLENITNPMIINQPVNIIGFEQAGSTVNNIKFVAGSDNSNITSNNMTSLIINNLTIEGASRINVKNNTINGLVLLNNSIGSVISGNYMETVGNHRFKYAEIVLYNSVNNIIEDNYARVRSDYVISIDSLSYDNEIINNNLISCFAGWNYETAMFSHYGNDCIQDNGTNVYFNNTQNENYILSLDTHTFALNQVYPLTVNVTNNGYPVTTGKVVLIKEGTEVGEGNIENGIATITVYPTEEGSYNIRVWYLSDESIMPQIITETITVKELVETNITIDYTGKVNSEASVTFTVHDEENQPITEGTLDYTINGESKSVDLTESTYTINLEDTESVAGKTVTATYTPAQARYASSTNSTTLDLTKADTTIEMVYDVIDDNNGNLTITLTDEFGNTLAGKRFTLSVDGVQSVQTTEASGSITVPVNSDKKEIVVTATYMGSSAFNNATLEKTVKLVKDTSFITVISNTPTVEETLEISGTLTDENSPIANAEVILTINNENVTVITNDNGEYTYSLDPDKGTYNIIATYTGNENYTLSTNKTKVYVKDPNNVDVEDLLNEIEELKEENQKQIEQQNEILSQLLDIINNLQQQINNQTQTINELNDKLDNLTQANEDLAQQLEDTTNNLTDQITELTSTIDTSITVDSIDDVIYNDSVVVTGKLTDSEDNVLGNSYVVITLNGNETIVKTGANGVYTYTTKAGVVGVNNVSVNYEGKDRYTPSAAETTFTVSKIDTSIILNSLSSVKKDNEITITGKLIDQNDNVLANSVVKLLINNGRATVKTDANGVFNYTYKFSRIGTNNITASFLESEYYNPSSTTTTVEVISLDSIITFDDIGTVNKGAEASISGTLTDENGNVIANAQVKIIINGSTKTLKTDSEGKFTHTYTMNTLGDNTITASYAGSASYMATESEITVKVVKGQAKITIDPIDTITQGNDATISGTITDENENVIANAQVKIIINGSPRTIKADANGVFTFTYAMKTLGTNNITVTYAGSNSYMATESTTTFEVIKADI